MALLVLAKWVLPDQQAENTTHWIFKTCIAVSLNCLSLNMSVRSTDRSTWLQMNCNTSPQTNTNTAWFYTIGATQRIMCREVPLKTCLLQLTKMYDKRMPSTLQIKWLPTGSGFQPLPFLCNIHSPLKAFSLLLQGREDRETSGSLNNISERLLSTNSASTSIFFFFFKYWNECF